MACCERNTRNMLIFVVCLALWDLTDCAVIRTVQLSKWDDVKGWWKDLPTLPTFDWDKKSTPVPVDWKKFPVKSFEKHRFNVKLFVWDKNKVKSFDRDEKPTTVPINWKKFSVEPFRRHSFKVKPFDRHKFEVKPFDQNEKPTPVLVDWKKFSVEPFERYRFTVKPFDLDKYKVKPFVREEKPTPVPVDWKKFNISIVKSFERHRFTVKPFDWNRFRFTKRPFEWKRFTSPPRRPHHRHKDNTILTLAIIIPTFIGLILVFICNCFICKRGNSSVTSTPILHPPPRRTVPPPTRTVNNSIQNGVWPTPHARQTITSLREELFSSAPNRNSHENNQFNRSDGIDKPPSYYDVVSADLYRGQSNFPEVKPSASGTPPPDYNDKSVRY